MRKDAEEDIFQDDDDANDSTATYEDYLKLQASQAEDDEEDAEAESDDNDAQPEGDDAADADDSGDDDDDKDSDDSDGPDDDAADDKDTGADDKADDDADEKSGDDVVDQRVKLQIERAEARAEHAQQAHDALTGRYGTLVQDFKKLQERLAQRDRSQRDERDDDSRQEFDDKERQEIADLRRKVEELQSARRDEPTLTAEQVLLQEAHGFAQSSRYRTDCAKYEQPIKDALSAALEPGARLTKALDSGDMEAARFIARDVMREAYYDAKDAAEAAVAEENRKRREKTSKTLKRKKRDAAPSGVGTRGKSRQDDFDLDPDALTKNPSLARDPKFLKRLQRAGQKLGR